MSMECWCGRSYARGRCPVHGQMRQPPPKPPEQRRIEVTGARDDGTALADLLTALEALGFITDSTTES